MKLACVFVFVALGWAQDAPPQKEHPGGQAGSGGKTVEPMGSKGGKETPLQKCDPDKKPDKKKKAKKPEPTKS